MNKTDFRKVVQVAQLVRAKDWKSLCQWFESTSKRAKGPKAGSEPDFEIKVQESAKKCERSCTIRLFCVALSCWRQISKKKLFLRFSRPCAQKDGWVRFECSSIGWIYMLRGGETRCSAVWSAHLFWVQRAIGSNPVTLMWGIPSANTQIWTSIDRYHFLLLVTRICTLYSKHTRPRRHLFVWSKERDSIYALPAELLQFYFCLGWYWIINLGYFSHPLPLGFDSQSSLELNVMWKRESNEVKYN